MSRIKNKTTDIKSLYTLPEAGKIGIGIKHPEKGYPIAVDWFVCKSNNKRIEQRFRECFGEKPNTLVIVFPSDDSNHVCNQRYEIRKGTQLAGQGDGENFTIYHEGKEVICDKAYIQEKYNGNVDAFMKKIAELNMAEWQEVLTLKFMLIEMAGVLGQFKLTTKGKASSIKELIGVFDSTLERVGTVKGLPFELSVKMHSSDKKGSKSKYPVLSLVPNLSLQNAEAIKGYISAGNEFKTMLLTDSNIQETLKLNQTNE